MTGLHTSTSARHSDGSGRRLDGPDRHLQFVATGEHGLPAELAEMMEAEVTEIAGAKGRHNPDRTHTRHGTEHGSVTLGGRRLR